MTAVLLSPPAPALVEPRHHTQRDLRYPTRGGAVAKIAAAKRRPLMPWQRRAADVALEYDPATGLYRYGIVVVSVPRQSGKTKLESDLADHRCLTIPEARVWITMQNGKTVDSWMREEHFSAVKRARIFGTPGTPGCRYSEVRRAGEVGVSWHDPVSSTFYTFPPKRDALHSKQSDLVFVDEAWAHDAETGAALRQAIRPTLATRRGSQLWIVSTMGDDASTFFDGYVQSAIRSLSDPGTRVCFIDYGLEDDDDPEDLELLASKHPAYGHTIDLQALLDAREDFRADPLLGGAAGWARAYGNVPTRSRVAAIPPTVWAAAGKPLPELAPGRRGIALDVTPDGSRAAVGGAYRDDQGVAHLELLYAGPTSRELPQLLAQLAAANDSPLVVDRGSFGALEVTDAVAQLPKPPDVRFLSLPEYAQACGTIDRGLRDGTVQHHLDPDLDAAVEVATKVDKGDGMFGWGRKGSAGSIAELVAATVALKAFDTLPPPKRKPVARTSRPSTTAPNTSDVTRRRLPFKADVSDPPT